MSLAARTDTTLHTWPERQVVFDSDGTRIPDSDVPEIAEGFWSIVSDAFKYSRENTATIPASESLFDFVKKAVAEKWTDEPDGEVVQTKRRRLLRETEMWGAFVGSAVQRQSLKFFWLEETVNGENPFVAETYQKILAEIARPALEKAEVRLGMKVDRVSYSASGVTIAVAGRKEEYDEVIVTSPLGWLQLHQDTFFEPPLPEGLSNAITNIGYGNLDKVLITFPKAFWEQGNTPDGGHMGDSKDAAPNLKATTAPHHQPDKDEDTPPEHYPGFTLFYSNADLDSAHSNIQNAMNLAGLPSNCAHPTLLFYIFGSCAADVAKLKTDKALIDFFRPHFSLLQNYSADNPDCEPKAVLSTNWTSDEMAGYGSYSTFRTGLEEGDRDIEIMRHGVPERHLWIAGEHTAPFEALGTVTGAYWAGEGVAGRLLRRYGLVGKE